MTMTVKIHKDYVELSRELAVKLAREVRDGHTGPHPDPELEAFAQALNPRPKVQRF
jgi:hypothetical protein